MNKNKNKLKVIASVIAMFGSANVIAQNNVTANFDTTATIESSCSINAGDINFGVVSLPLTAQSANTQMNVLCSNNTPYTVDLSYGGNFVDPTGSSSSGGYTVSTAYKTTEYSETQTGAGIYGYRIYNNGQPIGNGYPLSLTSNQNYDYNLNGDNNLGDFVCNGTSTSNSRILLRTQEAANLLYPGSKTSNYIPDTKGICTPGTSGRVNMDSFNAVVGNVSISDKGSMVGTFKGDQLAYQITLPNDSTKPWIAKVNSYSATGSGSNQVIDMNAKIVPSASSSSYIAADTYLDTVIATVSY